MGSVGINAPAIKLIIFLSENTRRTTPYMLKYDTSLFQKQDFEWPFKMKMFVPLVVGLYEFLFSLRVLGTLWVY